MDDISLNPHREWSRHLLMKKMILKKKKKEKGGGVHARTYGSAVANLEPKAALLTFKSVPLPLFQVPSPEIYT